MLNNFRHNIPFTNYAGYLDVCNSPDEDGEYEGIDIEYISDNDKGQYLSRPRILIEAHEGVLRALIWNDPEQEDYNMEVELCKLDPRR